MFRRSSWVAPKIRSLHPPSFVRSRRRFLVVGSSCSTGVGTSVRSSGLRHSTMSRANFSLRCEITEHDQRAPWCLSNPLTTASFRLLTFPPFRAHDVVERSTLLTRIHTARDLGGRAQSERSSGCCAVQASRVASSSVSSRAATRRRRDGVDELDLGLRAHRSGRSDPSRRRGGGGDRDASSVAYGAATRHVWNLRVDAKPALRGELPDLDRLHRDLGRPLVS